MASIPHTSQGTSEDAEGVVVADAKAGKLTEARREKVRAAAVADIPWWYAPWGHLAATTGVGVAALAVGMGLPA